MKSTPTAFFNIRDRALITCSCGATCVVAYYECLVKWLATDEHWVFSIPGGWNCGQPGHTQANVAYLEHPDISAQ